MFFQYVSSVRGRQAKSSFFFAEKEKNDNIVTRSLKRRGISFTPKVLARYYTRLQVPWCRFWPVSNLHHIAQRNSKPPHNAKSLEELFQGNMIHVFDSRIISPIGGDSFPGYGYTLRTFSINMWMLTKSLTKCIQLWLPIKKIIEN